MKSIVLSLLWFFVALKLRSRPKIIGITGSAGKTSTRRAVATLLERKYNVLASVGNLNSEFGVAYVLLNLQMPARRWQWPLLVVRAFISALIPVSGQKVIILELGADKPGDIAFFTKRLNIDISIITNIGIAHIANYGSREAILQEKMQLARAVKHNGLLIYNVDDELLSKAVEGYVIKHTARFGSASSDCRIQNLRIGITGVRATLKSDQRAYEVHLPTISKAMLWSVAPAIIVSEHLALSANQILAGLKKISVENGRGRILKGRNNFTIIDHSYNANPTSVRLALESLAKISCRGKRVVVIGDMAELGAESASAHRAIGELARQSADQAYSFGEEAKATKLKNYQHHDELSEFLLKQLSQDDIVLFIGSQCVRLEKIITALIAASEEKDKVLVRQSKFWRNN